jgi:hypothetical protein
MKMELKNIDGSMDWIIFAQHSDFFISVEGGEFPGHLIDYQLFKTGFVE